MNTKANDVSCGADARLVPADLMPGWYSAYNVEGLNGVVFRNRNGWHFWNRANDAFGGVHTRADAVAALAEVQGLVPSSDAGAKS